MKFIKNTALVLLLLAPIQLNAKEFLNTLLHINFTFMFSWSNYGSILDEENEYSIYDSINNTNVNPDHTDTAYGLTVDITPFPSLVLGNESHAVKFGIRAGYRFHTIQQEITTESNNYNGELLEFQTWMVGPIIYYAPSINPSRVNREYNAGAGIVLYMLFGKIIGGKLTAYPSMRDFGDTPPGDYETSVSGYKIDIGIGFEVSVCSVNLGLNVFYSIIQMQMDQQIYSNLGKDTTLKEINVEIFLGIPINFY